VKEIKLRNCDLVALVDDEDYDVVSTIPWYKFQPPRSTTTYARTNQMHGNFLLHILVMGCPAYHIDHRNRNGLDCRRENLRPATRTQQTANSSCAKKGGACQSQFKGVHLHHTGKWVARIHVNRKPVHLGMFVEETDAAFAYNKAATERFGEYALLNEVPDA
jgi:hypothetical protein